MGTLQYLDDLLPQLGDVPAWLPLGWIDQESSGRLDLVDRTAFADGEYSLFQLSPDERKQLGSDAARMLTDATYSIQQGMMLIQNLAQSLVSQGLPYGQDDMFWFLVKLEHAIGTAGTEEIIKDMRANGVEPDSPSTMAQYFCDGDCPREGGPVNDADNRVKDAIKARTGTVHYPSKWIYNANQVYVKGKLLSAAAGIVEALPAAIGGFIKRNPTGASLLFWGSLAALAMWIARRK